MDYSLYVVGQASRRAWRLIQERECRVFYPYYTGLMENQAVELIGLKQQAAGLLYGEETGGLSTLKSAGGGNLLAELAAEMGADKTIADLGTLFARHAQASDPTESAWFTETPLEGVIATEPVPEPEPILVLEAQPEPAADPLLRLAAELGSVTIEVQETPQIKPTTPAPLPPRKLIRRRRVKLTDAPEDEPITLHETPKPAPHIWQPLPPASQTVTQLTLF